MTAPRWVAAIGVCALVIAFALALLRREAHRSGTDYIPNGAFIVDLGPGQDACQGQELIPADTAAVELTIGTYGRPAPPIEVTASSSAGRLLTDGSLRAGWKQGEVHIPVKRVLNASPEARVCVRDLGSKRENNYPIALAGDRPYPGVSMQVAGQTLEMARLRFEYLRPGRESWYQLLPTLVYRFSLAKAGFLRHWESVAALLLVLATALVAVWSALRYIAPSRQQP